MAKKLIPDAENPTVMDIERVRTVIVDNFFLDGQYYVDMAATFNLLDASNKVVASREFTARSAASATKRTPAQVRTEAATLMQSIIAAARLEFAGV